MYNEELLYAIALTKIDKVGAVTAKNLVNFFGTAQAVFKARKKDLLRIPQIVESMIPSFLDPISLTLAEKELRYIEKEGIQLLFYTDPTYPARLKNYNDCPFFLFYKGTSNLNMDKIIAVVGTRKMTEYGKAMINQLIDALSGMGILVVSGLAYGVDSQVHKRCIETGIETIGILGHGLDRIYPAENRSLAKSMIGQGGLLTEFGINTKPDRENFPKRNRIVAGMSDAIIVVETLREGGSMITASYANQYNKDVFAFPGKAQDPYSSGCNFLIKNHQAQLIESAEDLILNMRWDVDSHSKKQIQQQLFVDLDEDETCIIQLLKENNSLHIDHFHQNLEFSPGQLASLLIGLEFKGVLQALPGKKYTLVN